MKISEVAELTGLSISNIRFYERKGLIAPDRRVDSKYRDYTAEDVELIKRIIFYRKMDLPIEEIQAIICEGKDHKKAVREHLSELNSKKEIIDNSMELCRMFLDEEEEDADIDYYISYVNSEEKQGKLYAKIDELYSDFEEFSKGTLLPDNSLISAFIPETWRRRLSVFFLGLIIVGLPLVALLHVGEEGFLRVIIIWAIWLVFLILGFINFRNIKK